MTVRPTTQSTGVIRLNVRAPTLGSGRHTPWAQVDGSHVPVDIGDNLVEVTTGRHLVQVAPHWDPARVRTAQVDVAPGAEVRLFYADPPSRFLGGSLGFRRRQDWALRCLQAYGVLLIVSLLAELLPA